MIFSSVFLHAATFSHVQVVKSQIALNLKVKTKMSLCMAIYNAEQPIAIPIITQCGSTVYIGMAMGGSAL